MRHIHTTVALVVTALLAACTSTQTKDARQVKPDDFVASGPAQAPAAPAAAPVAAAPVETAPPADGPADQPTASNGQNNRAVEQALQKMTPPVIQAASAPAPRADNGPALYTVDAMVGQVNGQALYAGQVLDPITQQLRALGQSQPTVLFRREALKLIVGRLDQIVTDALILGEAERDLNAQERAGLEGVLKDYREDVLRQYNRSTARAEDELRATTGKGLEGAIEDYLQRILVQRYLQVKLLPKINVTRKDIERYYADHPDRFNPPAGRTLRLIQTTSESAADQIDAQLAQGKSFQEVATSNLNRYKPTEAGLFAKDVKGDTVFGPEALNDAMLKLKPGEHSARVKVNQAHAWVHLESMNSGQAKPLREVQLDIERELRNQRFRALSERYIRDMRERGAYNPLEQMAQSLLEVALARFGPPA